jgi:uncharacterized protein (TIGR02611 family)
VTGRLREGVAYPCAVGPTTRPGLRARGRTHDTRNGLPDAVAGGPPSGVAEAMDQVLAGEKGVPADPEHPRHKRAVRARRRWRRFVARIRAVRARVRRTPAGRIGWRVGVGVVGGLLLVAGIIMIPGPGQGWATVFLALAVLSTEFGWARRLRHGLWVRMVAARHHWSRSSPRKKAVLGTAVVIVTVLALAGVLWGSLAVAGLPGWVPVPVADLVGRVPGV